MPSFIRGCLVVAALLGLQLVWQPEAAADQVMKFAPAPPRPEVGRGGDGVGLPESAPSIHGYLTRPKGKGPFPAVILLHSCLGLPSNRKSIEDKLSAWGYVALFVDDFATRGLKETCAVEFPEGLADAAGALTFVAGLPYVDRTRIAVVGYSQGADTALQLASARPAGALPNGPAFKAAAAFYPPCQGRLGARLALPTLILVGAADTVTPAAACEQLAASQPGGEVKLIVYPGAGHVFDDPQFAGGRELLGMWLQFDRRAAQQSQSALHDFLAAKLAR